MDKVRIRKISIKITIILAFFLCSQYILTGVYIGKEITNSIKRRNINILCYKRRNK